MSIVFAAALNPNISSEQLVELVKRDGDAKVRLIETFGECAIGIKDPRQRAQYISTCLPILMQMIF